MRVHPRVPTRNQRLAALHTFFEYVGSRRPGDVRRVPADHRGDTPCAIARCCSFCTTPARGCMEAADLRVEHLDLERGPRARLHGKGGKWRTCPLWDETARLLRQLAGESPSPQAPVFCSAAGKQLTRFGIYKLVRAYRASSGRALRGPPDRATRLSAHDRRSSVGGRRRGQRDPRLARARQPRHDESLRGHQHPHQGGCPSPVRSATGRWAPEGTCAGLAERRDHARLARLSVTVLAVNRYAATWNRAAA
jgi:integrase